MGGKEEDVTAVQMSDTQGDAVVSQLPKEIQSQGWMTGWSCGWWKSMITLVCLFLLTMSDFPFLFQC